MQPRRGNPPPAHDQIPGDAPMTAEAGDGAAPARVGGFASIVVRLTGINAVMILAGLIAGPITARALGAEGRGELAAIIAVLTMTPLVLDLGLSQWVARERAIGGRPGEVLGVALPLALACSLIGVVAAVPLGRVIGDGRPVVTAFVQVGLLLTPISVVLQTLVGLVIGESRWGLFAAVRVVGTILPVVAIVVLAICGGLTVGTAAAAYLGGGLAGGLLLLRMVHGVRRLSFDRARVRLAVAFGAKTWLSTLAAATTNRIDQVIMAPLVPSRELGIYVVAVTISVVAFSPVGVVVNVLFPRVAEGNAVLAARACRISLCAVAIAGLLIGAAAPFMIPFLFGPEFSAALPMAIILLVANVPAAAAFVLNSALSAANNPAATMRAELVALAFTLPALVVLLPEFGGHGAAFVSLAAYTIRLAMQLGALRATFDLPWWRFVVPMGDDLMWLTRKAQRLVTPSRAP